MQFKLLCSAEVAAAIDENKPVVALESTIISHGMPFPRNVETALFVEQLVREGGAIPATIAIIDGKLRAGLSVAEIERLGKAGTSVVKASRRDIPYLVTKRELGATTVAATMIIAEMAGIRVFATGGIGGVHRGATTTLDISADLQELAKTNVAVVCAGVKSILDIGLTLEYLETHGVPVIGYKTADFPAFYTPQSGFQADYRLDTPAEIAEFLFTKWHLNLQGGAIIGNPIAPEFAMPEPIIRAAIEQALAEADKQKIVGKEITPFLLARIERLTEGNSLNSNIALIGSNASLAAKIAVAYAAL